MTCFVLACFVECGGGGGGVGVGVGFVGEYFLFYIFVGMGVVVLGFLGCFR